MRSIHWGLIPLLTLALPAGLLAQEGLGFTAEARAGWAIPAGDFSSGPGFTAEGGPSFALGGRLSFTSAVGIYAGYQQTRFGCDSCEALGLDDATVLEGLEAGFHLVPPLGLQYSPWLRLGIIQQQLRFSGFGDRLASESATGFSGNLGLAFELMPGLHLNPGLGFLSVPVDFDFETVPDRSIDVSAFILDLGIAYRF